MAESISRTTPLGQTNPIERVGDSHRGGVDQDGKRRRSRRPETPSPSPEGGEETRRELPAEETKKSGKILDIVI